MSDDPSTEIDFANEMQQLASQASLPKIVPSDGKPPASAAKSDKAETLLAIGEMVRPLALDLDGIKRAAADNNLLLTALGKTMGTYRTVPQSLETVADQMKRLSSVESANQKLFDALHAELKGYKDNFLFDALQKPFIRDLVTLFDDLSNLHAQSEERLRAAKAEGADDYSAERAFLEKMTGNLENQVHHLLEIFLRMEVTVATTPVGAPVDKRTHRAVSVVPAATANEDATVARSVRPGFIWRERMVRPEDVSVRRWTPPAPEPPRQTPIFSKQNAPETVLIPTSLPTPSGFSSRKDSDA